ncbi:MAG: glycosyltransferase, partial [Candidatus Aenigmarchaeota archaeon]|nr:glycosyltransferase [Candidatus Aenigmarchaeota archaeon]MDW8149418.1 glycosyltransferase [Candidatus Aenigmarchaeota archaeon]
IIVVDDGSEDRTYEIAKKYTKKVFKIEHSGKARACNFGIEKAKGEFILILDSDTTIEKDFFEKTLSYFEDKKVAAVTPMVKSRKEKKLSILETFQNIEFCFQSVIKLGFSTLKRGCLSIYGVATIYRANVLKSIKFNENSIVEDFDMAISLQKNGYKISVSRAFAYTNFYSNIKKLFLQRVRWSLGVLKSLIKNKNLFFKEDSLGLYSFPTSFFWYPFILISFPSILYQIFYWLPENIFEIPFYLFKWFSIAGPINSLIMLPVWGVKLYIILGSLSGLLPFILTVISLKITKELNVKNFLFSCFIFPYYFFIINIAIVLSVFLFFLKINLKWYK